MCSKFFTFCFARRVVRVRQTTLTKPLLYATPLGRASLLYVIIKEHQHASKNAHVSIRQNRLGCLSTIRRSASDSQAHRYDQRKACMDGRDFMDAIDNRSHL
jgi:hypothetical protein